MSSAPPANYPFAPYLSSIDPEGIYPAAKASGPLSSGYEWPHLRSADHLRLEAHLTAGGVVDPLNLVFWGSADLGAIANLVGRLQGWTQTLFSSPQWGLRTALGTNQKLPDVFSMQPGNALLPRPILFLTKVVHDSWARHHVRLFQPFEVSDDWGHITLAGAHSESVSPRARRPFLWHRINDWEVARDALAGELRQLLGENAFAVRRFPTEGRWQTRPFDGRVIFVHL